MKPALFRIPPLLCLLAACTHNVAAGTPEDVARFVEARDTCDYFRGEIPDPGQIERAKEVADGLRTYCTGTDAELQRLRTKYVDNPDVSSRLRGYDDRIEARKP